MQLIIEYYENHGSQAAALTLREGTTSLTFGSDYVAIRSVSGEEEMGQLSLQVTSKGVFLGHVVDDLQVVGLSRSLFTKSIQSGTRLIVEGRGLRFTDQGSESFGVGAGGAGDAHEAAHEAGDKNALHFIVKTSVVKQSGGGIGGSGDSAREYIALLNSLRDTVEPEVIVERLLGRLTEILGGERGFVLLTDDEGNLVPVTVHGAKDQAHLLAISSTVCETAMAATDVLVIKDSFEDERCASAASIREIPYPLFIVCAPLRTKDECFGVVYIDRPRDKEGPSVERELLSLVTSMTAELVGVQRTRARLVAAHRKVATMSTIGLGNSELVLGEGKAAQELREQLKNAATQDVTVLITGETGTGKEMVARALHELSDRKLGPFVPVNCAALSQELIEAELFGVAKGAYTGAGEGRLGRFELAEGGTLFLDELGELSESTQVKLLRVLQERQVTRVGGTTSHSVDFRLICATNRDLTESVTKGAFRKDLYYRVNVFHMQLLPLRERREEIAMFADHFLSIYRKKFKKQIEGFSEDALAALEDYQWPGNVRELCNVIERATLVTGDREQIEVSALPLAGGQVINQAELERAFWDKLPDAYEDAREVFERTYLKRLVEKNEGNMRAAARTAGFPRSTLYRRMKKYGFIIEE